METFHGVTVSFHLSVYKFTTDKIYILSGRTISILSDVIGERCALKYNGVPVFGGITINTLRHMYIFELVPNSIYCRAARFVATNKGIVFNQNFRQGFEAYMIEDNNDARLLLEYDEAMFNPDACVWNNRSVYWSLEAFTDNEITLRGCQGDTYYWRRTDRH